MRLTKHHGLGNDFLVVLLDAVPADAPDLARRLCDRHRGVGADGLVFGVAPTLAGTEVAFRLFNADGSVAEVSGNGLRCFGQALAMAVGRETSGFDVVVDTLAGARRITLAPTSDPVVAEAAVQMGLVSEGPGVRGGFDAVPGLPPVVQAATADIGNPHLVLHVADLAGADPAQFGPALEARYESGINVHVLAPDGPDAIRMTIWERGAGVTAACGSGACVAAARARDWGLVGDRVRVRMPGGEATVTLGEDVVLAGPAVFVATIEVPDGER